MPSGQNRLPDQLESVRYFAIGADNANGFGLDRGQIPVAGIVDRESPPIVGLVRISLNLGAQFRGVEFSSFRSATRTR